MHYIISIKLFLKKNYGYQSFLDKVALPKFNKSQTLKFEGAITESELLKALLL